MPRRKFKIEHVPQGTWDTKIDQPARRAQGFWRPRSHDWSRIDRGWLDPKLVAEIQGRSNEHLLFERSPTGRKTKQQWSAFKASIRRKGVEEPVDIRKEADGSVTIYEGNHRTRAAAEVGVMLPVVITYFGASEEDGLVYDPETGVFDPHGRA